MLIQRLEHLALQQLVREGRIEAAEADRSTLEREARPLSLQHEIRILLFLGGTGIATGTGFWIYRNIHSLGHYFLVALLTLGTLGGFAFCWKRRQPFSSQRSDAGTAADAMLLVSCLLAVVLWGYLQWRYGLLVDHPTLIPLFPALAFSALAYRLDHRGVLSLAITGFAAWLGLTINPWDLMRQGEWLPTRLAWTAYGFGVLLLALSLVSERRMFKPHFAPTYHHFALQVMALAGFTGMLRMGYANLWLVLLLLACATGYARFRLRGGFDFFTIALLWAYAGITWRIVTWVIRIPWSSVAGFYLILGYLLLSGWWVVHRLADARRKP